MSGSQRSTTIWVMKLRGAMQAGGAKFLRKPTMARRSCSLNGITRSRRFWGNLAQAYLAAQSVQAVSDTAPAFGYQNVRAATCGATILMKGLYVQQQYTSTEKKLLDGVAMLL